MLLSLIRPHFLPDGWAERTRREGLDGLGNFSFVVCRQSERASERERDGEISFNWTR